MKTRLFVMNGKDATFDEMWFYDYSKGTMSLYYPSTRLKATRSLWRREREIWHSRSDCASEGSGWEVEAHPELETIHGYAVVKRSFKTFPRSGPEAKPSDTARILERWVAPELDCYDLQMKVFSLTPDGKQTLDLVVETTAIEHDVDENLLEVPSVPEVHVTDLRRSAYEYFDVPFEIEKAEGIADRFYGRAGKVAPAPCRTCGSQ